MSYTHNRPQVRSNPKGKHQQGVVIVVALFIVALVAVMSYGMMSRLERDTRRTTLILRAAEAEYYAQGSIAWAKDQLLANLEKQRRHQLVDVMPFPAAPLNMNGFIISSTIYDAQERFNLNTVNEKTQNDFVRLMRQVYPKLSEEEARAIARATADWVTFTSQDNELNKYYLEQPLPYRSPHHLMVNSSELRLVKGMTVALFNALKPYVIALPEDKGINVQTASVPILMTLDPSISPESAQKVLKVREKTPFLLSQQFTNLEVLKGADINPEKISVISDFFLLSTQVSIDKQHLVLYTLLQRNTNEGKSNVSIVWQSKIEEA